MRQRTIPLPLRAFQAEALTSPQPIRVSGDVDAPAQYFDGRAAVDMEATANPATTVITVNSQSGVITLIAGTGITITDHMDGSFTISSP